MVAEERSEVSDDNRERVREVVRTREFDRRAVIDVDINVRIGAFIPRRYDLYIVPDVIIDIAPAYRDYRYVIIEDEICIVDPDTYVIVAVYDYRGSGHRDRFTLTSAQERCILDHIDRDYGADIDVDIRIGKPLPRSVELLTFPDEIVREVPKMRAYRYVVVENDVLIVEPDDNDVLLRIEG